jgi:hypothetical protein
MIRGADVRTTTLFAGLLLAALGWPASAAGADADPFAGKSLDEIRQILEGRMKERQKDRDFAREYQSFYGREERERVRWGARLAADARAKAGEYSQAEILYRFGQHVKALEILLPYATRLAAKGRQRGSQALILVYRLSAMCYAWLDKAPEAMIALGSGRRSGDSSQELNKIQKDAGDLPALRKDLEGRRRQRDLDPRNADKQWALCEFYQQKIFAPLEESIELAWMLQKFPEHAKVKAGEADWAAVQAQEKLFDVRSIPSLAEKFRKAFPDHWAIRQGDHQWTLAKAYFGSGNFKEAKKAGDLLKRQYPKHRRVENKDIDAFLVECDAAPSARGAPEDDGDSWNHWWEWPAG